MKKIIFGIILTFQTFCIYAQLTDAGKQSIDSLLKTGRLSQDQALQLQKKLNATDSYEFKVNKSTGEIDISDILSFTNLEKKTIYQRCQEWIALNYGNLVYSDLESGKIIANGLMDINHYAGYQTGFGVTKIIPIQTPVNYTMILTLKDNKIKYIITNITYNFKNFSETVDEISYPISALYQYKSLDQNWIRFFTVLNSSSDMFYISLKTSLVNYVKDVENDHNF
jgi:Domain of unknown function (DUF4468) with TBP-like fold